MKLLIISDSHGDAGALRRALDIEKPDALIHLGDGFRDLPAELSIPVYQVRGNCDFSGCDLPERVTLELDGVRIFITHGHLYRVKSTMMSLHLAALEADADLALFGHTHTRFLRTDPGSPCLFNPGSISSPTRSYGTVTLKDRMISCKHHTIL